MDEGVFHDEIEIEDFKYDPENDSFVYPCPCGDLFTISCVRFSLFFSYNFFSNTSFHDFQDDLLCGEVVASCMSCSLILKVIYDEDLIEDFITQKKKEENKVEKATEVAAK